MSLKINVVYKGILYRVRGMKVLCSVVLAVIVLLVAIVAMGIWMLVTAYDETNTTDNLTNNLSKDNETTFIPSIDFQHSSEFSSQEQQPETSTTHDDLLHSDLLLTTIKKTLYQISTESSTEKIKSFLHVNSLDEELPPFSVISRTGLARNRSPIQSPIPEESIVIEHRRKIYDPPLSRHNSPTAENKPFATRTMPNYDDYEQDLHIEYPDEHGPIEETLPIKRNPQFGDRIQPIRRTRYKIRRKDPKDEVDSVPEDILAEFESLGYPMERIDALRDFGVRSRYKVHKNREEVANLASFRKKRPIELPTVSANGFSRRSGDREELIYIGPPVVGYGTEPYKKLSPERIEEYESFWNKYMEKGYQPSRSRPPNSVNKRKIIKKERLRPAQRGSNPNGEGINLPPRLDAIEPYREGQKRPNKRFRPRRPDRRRLRPPPPPHSLRPPGFEERYDHDFAGTEVEIRERRPSTSKYEIEGPKPSTSNSGGGSSILGPFQDLYDYSRRLAASLLSFSTKPDNEIRNNTDKFVHHGMNLIQDYNTIFQQKPKGTLGRISQLIPTVDQLQSLDPFQMSLVTWTFLDFWEFLIEKVGTLSKEDLDLLQERLKRLRRKKDSSMTQSLLSETKQHMSDERERAILLESRRPKESTGDEIPEHRSLSSILGDLNNLQQLFSDIFPLKQDEGEEIDPEEHKMDLENLFNTSNDQRITSQNQTIYSQLPKVEPLVSTKKEPAVASKSDVSGNQNKDDMEKTDMITLETAENPIEHPGTSPDNVQSLDSLITNQGKLILDTSPTKSETQILSDSKLTKQTDTTRPHQEIQETELSNQFTGVQSDGRVFSSRQPRLWDPLGFFSSEARMQFMQYAVKVLFNFGKVYLKKPYALDCTMLLFCKDLNQDSKRIGMEGIAAKIKTVGLQVLTEKELRTRDTFGDVFRAVTSWSPLHCDSMFPKCDGPRALEIVNEVALGN